MRPIKFRAWDKNACRWIREDESGLLFLNFETAHTGAFYIHDESSTGHDEYDIGQFIGLYDCKGKEIYEGDIAEIGHDIYEVYWNEILAAFRMRFIRRRGETLIWGGYEGESKRELYTKTKSFLEAWGDITPKKARFEIIGNRYENPELLEEQGHQK